MNPTLLTNTAPALSPPDSVIQAVFDSYPTLAKERLLTLRALIVRTAEELGLQAINETLKWGEPSYLAKGGSTIRIAWKKKAPEQYTMFLNCKTQLLETYKELYPGDYQYEGNRAINFNINDNLQETPLTHCIRLALTYHQVKHLPLLGA